MIKNFYKQSDSLNILFDDKRLENDALSPQYIIHNDIINGGKKELST